jgi:EmrB/QacA subfamily drug resistance transporter
MVVLDASIVNVALPTIGEALDFSQENLSWVINAYVLTFGGFLLLGGRLADLLGRRRMFIVGLVLFAVASLAGGLAQTDVQLIVARAVQGIGGAIVSPAALSIITTTFREGTERNKALGAWGAVAGSGGAAGVLLGGVLTDSLGWEWVLWVNVPIGLIAAFFAPRVVAESRIHTDRKVFDFPGAVTITAGLSLLVYAIVDAEHSGWGSTKTVSLLVLSLLLVGAFIAIEARAKAPLVPFRIFRSRTLTGSNIVGLLLGASLFSMFFFATLYMQQVLGYSPIKTGLSYVPLTFGIMGSAAFGSVIASRIGFKPVLIGGMALTSVALLWWSRISPDGSYVSDVLGPSVIAALGLGFSFVPVTIGAVAGVAERESGLASGLINTAQQIGGALGLAILATIANSVSDEAYGAAISVGDQAGAAQALTDGFQNAFLVGASFAIVGLLLSIVLIRSSDSRAMVEHPPEPTGDAA